MPQGTTKTIENPSVNSVFSLGNRFPKEAENIPARERLSIFSIAPGNTHASAAVDSGLSATAPTSTSSADNTEQRAVNAEHSSEGMHAALRERASRIDWLHYSDWRALELWKVAALTYALPFSVSERREVLNHCPPLRKNFERTKSYLKSKLFEGKQAGMITCAAVGANPMNTVVDVYSALQVVEQKYHDVCPQFLALKATLAEAPNPFAHVPSFAPPAPAVSVDTQRGTSNSSIARENAKLKRLFVAMAILYLNFDPADSQDVKRVAEELAAALAAKQPRFDGSGAAGITTALVDALRVHASA